MNILFTHLKKNLVLVFTVIVLLAMGGFVFAKKAPSINDCTKISGLAEKTACWKKSIDSDLVQGEINHTMEIVAQTYASDPDFANNCHDFMHTVGKAAYELFAKGENFRVGDKTSYCAYGFYHGFMENLVSRSGDIALAQNFCKKVDSELSSTAPGAKLACYHGIGHGWTNVHDPSVFGNERAMVTPALALCEKVTSDQEELKICATGVFDSISISYYNQTDGLKMNKADPYWLCREQKDKYKIPCYMDLTPAIVWLGSYKLDKSLQYIKSVDVKYRELVVETMAEDVVRFVIRDNLNASDQVGVCRTLGPKLNLICLGGLVKGYLQFGPPEHEEESGLRFCETSGLNAQEKDYCYSKLLATIKFSVSKSRYEKVCSTYEKYCEI